MLLRPSPPWKKQNLVAGIVKSDSEMKTHSTKGTTNFWSMPESKFTWALKSPGDRYGDDVKDRKIDFAHSAIQLLEGRKII